jgi:hypothetical protein
LILAAKTIRHIRRRFGKSFIGRTSGFQRAMCGRGGAKRCHCLPSGVP